MHRPYKFCFRQFTWVPWTDPYYIFPIIKVCNVNILCFTLKMQSFWNCFDFNISSHYAFHKVLLIPSGSMKMYTLSWILNKDHIVIQSFEKFVSDIFLYHIAIVSVTVFIHSCKFPFYWNFCLINVAHSSKLYFYQFLNYPNSEGGWFIPSL